MIRKFDSAGNELNEYGFRKDYDRSNRFDLKDIVDGYLVSTVDLGLDHSFGIGEPLYYETMIFKINDDGIDYLELYCVRYPNEEKAREGHQKAIDYVKKGGIGG